MSLLTVSTPAPSRRRATAPRQTRASARGSTRARDGSELEALRVLVVEDEFLVASMLEDDLRSAGCAIVGPFRNLGAAIDAARSEAFDLAVLDINLNGEMVYPLADELLARGTAFLFLSGYGWEQMPDRFKSAVRLSKPHDPVALVATMRRLAAKRR
jgi:DNA-binding response OmpR family regulator